MNHVYGSFPVTKYLQLSQSTCLVLHIIFFHLFLWQRNAFNILLLYRNKDERDYFNPTNKIKISMKIVKLIIYLTMIYNLYKKQINSEYKRQSVQRLNVSELNVLNF